MTGNSFEYIIVF